LSFRGTLAPERAGSGRVVVVDRLRVGDRLAVRHLDVAAGEHVLVTGPNGSGKSTLLKVLAGNLAADRGTVQVSARRVGLLPQDVTFADPSRSAAEAFAAGVGRSAGSRPVGLGELGLLHPRDLSRPVGVLSVGQQRRVALAIVLARRPDLLLLDEPTNHVSLSLAEELEQALAVSPAAVVLASHDRWLRDRWTGARLALAGP
jgi:macrolide transport system ATP-binding/permease protein